MSPSRDDLFWHFVKGLLITVLVFGSGIALGIVFGASDSVLARMISTFGAMFTGLLGLGSGYILGKNGNGKSN